MQQAVEQRTGPLSFAQERLWFVQSLEDDSSRAQNEPIILELNGSLDVQALRRSLIEIVHRHEILRTRYVQAHNGQPMQVVMVPSDETLTVTDLSAVPIPMRERQSAALISALNERPFRLELGPIVRTALLRLSEQTHVLCVIVHHIAGDEWSVVIFLHELAALYGAHTRGIRPDLPHVMQYLDIARKQRTEVNDAYLTRMTQELALRLAGLSPAEFPSDRPQNAAHGNKMAWSARVLTTEMARAASSFSRRCGTTISNFLLTTFEVLLSRHIGKEQFTIGIEASTRDHPGTQAMIGLFINTIVFRADLTGNPSFQALLARASREVFEAYEHRHLPFEKIVAALQPTRNPDHAPFFEVVWSFHHSGTVIPQLAGLTTQLLEGPARRATASNLECQIYAASDQIRLKIGYETELFDESTIERLLRNWETVIGAVLEDPSLSISDLPIMAAAEREQVLVAFNRTERPHPRQLASILRAQRIEIPDAIAVSDDSAQLSFQALWAKVTPLAAHLRALGVGPEVAVAIYMHRGLDMLIAILAVIDAGGVFVPLDASHPKDRLAFMLEDSKAPVLLTEQDLEDQIAGGCIQTICLPDDYQVPPDEFSQPTPNILPDQLAYVIYTSGTTGRPKGVGVTHGGAANLLASQLELLDVRLGAKTLQLASFSFDAAIWELLVSIGSGRTLVLTGPETVLSSERLAGLIRREQVELALAVPSLLERLPDEGLACLEVLVTGAEACSAELASRWAPGRRFINAYGPTECSVIASMAEVAGSGAPSIGGPIANTRAYVMDRAGNPVPIGVHGELYLGGEGLARGYIGRASLTAERFVPDALSGRSGERLYRTGDVARWRADGQLAYVGRMDRQVKVRGQRIELEEIESVLRGSTGVSQAAVVLHKTALGDTQLGAYVVPALESDVNVIALQEQLRKYLPQHMIPQGIQILPSLPLTPSGKIDLKALSAMGHRTVEQITDVVPLNAAEELLAQIWADVLHIPLPGRHTNFFEIGGHSLLATQVIARVRQVFGCDIPLRTLFVTPTLTSFATQVEKQRERDLGQIRPPLIAGPRSQTLPLSFAQEGLWFLDQWRPAEVAYNVPLALRLTGALDVRAVAASISAVVRRHEILRTVFPAADGVPVQAVATEATVPLRVADLSELGDAEVAARQEAATEARRKFNLAKGPLLRLVVLRLSRRSHILLLQLHHIVSDGWSLGILVREFTEHYSALTEGRAANLPSLPVQYADYAAWQRQWLRGSVLEQQLQHWANKLAGVPKIDLRTDWPRRMVLEKRGAHCVSALSADLSDRMYRFARAHNVTPFITMLAAFEMVLHERSRQDQFTLGAPLANRDFSEIEHLVGFFVNMCPMIADLRGNPSIRELVVRVRDALLEVTSYQALPFDRIKLDQRIRSSTYRNSLFDVAFAVEDDVLRLPSLAQVEADRFPIETGAARFDLALWIRRSPERLSTDWLYDPDLFAKSSISALADRYCVVLDAMVGNADKTVSAILEMVLPGIDTAQAVPMSHPRRSASRSQIRIS